MILKNASKFLMVTALAAIGLSTSITDFKKAGLAPMFYGVIIDTLVTFDGADCDLVYGADVTFANHKNAK